MMKNIAQKTAHRYLGLTIVLSVSLLLALPVFAQVQTYQPLEPLPGSDGGVNVADPGGFFNQLFIVAVGLAALLATIMIAIGGLRYMGTDAWSTKEDAKKTIYSAVGGLILLLFSVLLLSIINPDLIRTSFPRLPSLPASNEPSQTEGTQYYYYTVWCGFDREPHYERSNTLEECRAFSIPFFTLGSHSCIRASSPPNPPAVCSSN